MGKVPTFDNRGLLPPGDYAVTFEDLRESPLVHASAGLELDTGWRLHLIAQAEMLIKQLWQVGIEDVFLDGSFVEAKAHPNDIDGYFVCDLRYLASGQLQRDLNELDPFKVWTWDPNARRQYRNYAKRQLPMWHRYRVELYPHYGQNAGIKDSHGHELQFPSAFRRQRFSEEPKGIVRIVRQ